MSRNGGLEGRAGLRGITLKIGWNNEMGNGGKKGDVIDTFLPLNPSRWAGTTGKMTEISSFTLKHFDRLP